MRQLVRRERPELAEHVRVREPRLLLELAQEAGLDVLAGLEPSGRNLCARVPVVGVVEDEQLLAPVALARDVREHAVGVLHCARSSALCARFASW
jgi:hypothetical protein